MRRVLALSLLLSGFVSEAYSQTALKFTRLTGYAPPSNPVPSPRFTVAADFDGDGVTDIAVAGQTVAVVYGPHSPFPAPVVAATLGDFVLDMVAGDFDGDGRSDLAFVVQMHNMTNETEIRVDIYMMLSRGRGFSPPRRVGSVDQPPFFYGQLLEAGDLNGDSRADLVVTGSSVRVLLSNSDGSFQERMIAPPARVPPFFPFGGAAIADFDGDGKADIAVPATQLALYRGNGDGSFREPLFGARIFANRVVAADIDSDGRMDLLPLGGLSAVLLGDGAGQFHAGPAFPDSPGSISLVDLDGDGWLDAVYTLPIYDNLVIRHGTGNGSFSAPEYFATGQRPYGVVTGDFDGNGRPDIATVGLVGSFTFLFAGPADYSRKVFPLAPFFTAIAAADFNGDGKPDIAGLDIASESVAILQGQGDGAFRPGARLAISPGGQTLVAVDFNNDRRPDLAVLSGSWVVEVFMNRGDGTFAEPVRYGLYGQSERLLVVDVNRDGKPDLVAIGTSFGPKTLLMGVGDGSFSGRVISVGGVQPQAVVDINGDGIPDLVSWGEWYDDGIGGLERLMAPGLGDGTFGPAIKYRVSYVDLDEDGATNPFVGECLWSGGYVDAMDVDGDGVIDFVTYIPQLRDSWIGSLRFGDGKGGCSYGIQFDGYVIPTALTGDWNTDGIPDLASASSRGFSLYLGKTNRQFEVIGFAGGVRSLVTADWNGDGKPDFAAVDSNSSAVVTFLNQPK